MALNFRAMNRPATAAVMQQEAQWYDAMLASDGTEAEFDVTITENGVSRLLTANVRPGKARSRTGTSPDGEQARDGQGTQKNVDIYVGPRSLMTHIAALQSGGHTMKLDGTTYTIMRAFPRRVAGVVYVVEMQVDANEGMSQPVGMGGML